MSKKRNKILTKLLEETQQEIPHFLNIYSQQVLNGDASLFLGSGISRDSGLPSWSTLLKPCAEELNIPLDEKTDLYSIAQYYVNRNKDSELRRQFGDAINKYTPENPLLNLLLEVPYNSIWTTNYDKLIEKRLEKQFIGCNPITKDEDLANVTKGSKINVYKMNGDVTDTTSMIITKNDYEHYAQKHPLLLTFLKRELVSSTFLFAGYSFSDSLVLNCLNSLKEFLGDSCNCHYAFMLVDDMVTTETLYFFEDMHIRYNVKCLALQKNDIHLLVKELIKKIREKKVFISGAYDNISDKEVAFADKLSNAVVTKLLSNEYRIATGVGKHLGTFITGYAHQYLAEHQIINPNYYLSMRPFPFHLNLDEEDKIQYRKIMQADCSAAIFMFGQSKGTELKGGYSKTGHYSEGVYMEYTLAKKAGLMIIPVGSTGYESEIIWNEVKTNINQYYYLSKKIDKLHNEKDSQKLIEIIFSILNDIPKKNRI
jgi:hypothetical protein